MKKKIFILIYIILLLLLAKQALNIFYNKYVLSHYRDHDYSINLNLLESMNFFESYIVYYNNGDILYKNMQFKDAYKKFEKALEAKDLPKHKTGDNGDRECKIRVNMALCKVKMLDENYSDEDHIDESIELLNEAKDILLKKDCATDDDDGHFEDAQTLKNEIDELLEELDKIKNPPPPEEPPEPDPNTPSPTPDPLASPQPGGPGEPGQPATPTPQDPESGTPTPNPEDPTPSPEPSDGDPTPTPEGQNPDDPDNGNEPDPGNDNGDDPEEKIRKRIKDVGEGAAHDRNNDLDYYRNKNNGINLYGDDIW